MRRSGPRGPGEPQDLGMGLVNPPANHPGQREGTLTFRASLEVALQRTGRLALREELQAPEPATVARKGPEMPREGDARQRLRLA